MRWLGGLGLVMILATAMSAQESVESAARRGILARVRPGDRIGLHFLRERELSESLTVNERGEAAFPKLGIIRVDGMTIGELQDTLRTRYAEYMRMPELEIAVLRRVTVNGEVRIPNVYLVDGTSSVRDVIARAGGVTDAGNRNGVEIVREGRRIPVRGWDRGDGQQYDLQSGDQVVVPRKNWLSMNALPVVSTAVLVASFVIQITR
jgi:polysaccharide export outer membrane protein